MLQLKHIQTYPFVQSALASHQLELHGWVYYLRRRLMGYYNASEDKFSAVIG